MAGDELTTLAMGGKPGGSQGTNSVTIGDAVPRRGNRITRLVAGGLLALFGWRVAGELPNLPKSLLIGAPHTSNWDMVLGMVVMYALGLRITWLAKHTLFHWPVGGFMRWLGGFPVDRRASQGLVNAMIAEYQQRKQFLLVILPEGTRSSVRRWKTGFYHIAQGANIPLVLVKFDYGHKVVGFEPLLSSTGDLAADLPHIQSLFAGIQGKFSQ